MDIQPPADRSLERPWSLTTRVLFRFGFCSVLLFLFFGGNGSPLITLPLVGRSLDESLERPMALLAQKIGVPLFHLSGHAAELHVQATSDSALRWVALALILAVSLLTAAVWSVVDRRRVSYNPLLSWLRLVLRLGLGVAMLQYGFIKVFPIQFPSPPLAVLNEPVGSSSALTLFWSLYGVNPAFVMTLGWIEVVAGLLLFFRKTAFAGALLTLAAMTNVALLDLSFNVPVKLYSLSLVAMALVLLAPEAALFWRLLLTGEPVSRSNTWGPLLAPRRARTLFAGEVLLAALACYTLASGTYSVWRMKADTMRHPPSITGEWHIDGPSGILGGNDAPIVTLFVDPNSDAMLRGSDGLLWRSRAIYDQPHQTLRLLYEVYGMLTFRVVQPDADHLVLSPVGPGAAQQRILHMTRIPLPPTYPLLHRDFQWVTYFEPLR